MILNSKKYFCSIILIVLNLLFSYSAWSSESDDIRRYLQEFHSNPTQAMDRLPQLIVNGHAIERGFIDYSKPRRLPINILSAPLSNDLASSIVDNGIVNSNIESLDQLRLTSASLKQIPWADSYWPTHKGLIGIRYNDPHFPDSKKFQTNYDYISSKPANDIVNSGNTSDLDLLSPAEKYDLLVGDTNWTMTNYSWGQGKSYMDRDGYVPTWVGICHGWSAASSMGSPVSHKPIVAKSVNNIPITFYPSDIKALQSMLWANASPRVRFVGTKCNISNPARDPIGRIIDPACLDDNPATFHLIMANQLGLNQRSFIMDATYDAEVWNFPLASYKYRYFNPETLEPHQDYNQSIIPIERFSIDKFKKFRSPQTRYLIGIVMDDTYVVEIYPNHSSQDVSPLKTIRYFYDLELDENYKVIGGEWYANAHPDFIWTYDASAVAKSIVDNNVNPADWGSQDPLPKQWTSFAQTASARGQPILGIINSLLSREAH